jgi:recombination protein RecR
VENVSDLMAIERSGQFKGLYHILGGVLNPLLGVGPEQLRLDELEEKIKRREIAEIILAVNPSVEGDATCAYIRSLIDESVKVERIGFGVPIGGSLEYLDSMTISKALENRKKF